MTKEEAILIEEFKKHRLDKSPEEIVKHYKSELQAIQDAMHVISGRWKIPIISLLCNGEFRYSELQKGLPKITPRMLSKELKDLEVNELIVRRVHDCLPVKVSYKLAEYGYSLVPLIIELTKWGMQHRAKRMGQPAFLAEENYLND